MATKFHIPTRMCVSCRNRHNQNTLLRLQCKDASLESFNGNGRSFYLCIVCLDDEKKLAKSLMRQCRSSDKERLTNRLKEIIADDR
jgi:uncharacterized protein